jgi:hypothetical protein
MGPLIINTRGDGVLDDTSPEDVAEIAKKIAQAPRSVIHLHGGLVSKDHGLATAARLGEFYSQHGIVSVFFVWQSGLLETIRNNTREIFDEKIFKALLKMLLKWAGAKVAASVGGRAVTEVSPLNELTIEQALYEARQGQKQPLTQFDSGQCAPLTSEEQQAFEKALRQNKEFRIAFDSLMLGLGAEPPTDRARIAGTEASPSHISKSIKEELAASVRTDAAARGFFDPVALVIRASIVLSRIVRRFLLKRDHGLYTTVVEELLRELYLDAIGSWIWGRMKKDTRDTFDEFPPNAPRGGRLFVAELGKQLATTPTFPKLSVIGHSAGTIFACHLLEHIDQQRSIGTMPKDFRFDHIAFLAAACQCTLFDKILRLHGQRSLFNSFRLYSLCDALEAGYWEAPPLYPRSLLYMISGLLEQPDFDMPLVGMQRYFNLPQVYKQVDVGAIRAFLSSDSRQVWSEFDGGSGLRSNAIRHGGFDETASERANTMDSVVYFLNS